MSEFILEDIATMNRSNTMPARYASGEGAKSQRSEAPWEEWEKIDSRPASFPRAETFNHAERRMMENGLKEHRETTERLRNGLIIVEQTTEVAQHTLTEVHRQGQQINKASLGVETLEKDIHEAGRILKFMRRWCCFQILCCCDCFDPTAQESRTRSRRLQMRKQDQEFNEANLNIEFEAKRQAVARITSKNDPVYNNDVETAREELFTAYTQMKAPKKTPLSSTLGEGFDEVDRIELQGHTQQQDEYLERIGTGVENLRLMSHALCEELDEQTPAIENLGDNIHKVHDNLGDLSRQAKKI